MHTSAGGKRVRIRLSNEMGSSPLAIGTARIALHAGGGAVKAGSDRPLTFSGNPSITIAPGAPVLSDPVELDVPAQADLAVSLYLPGTATVNTLHSGANQTSQVSAPGDFTAAASLPGQASLGTWPFLTEVDVEGEGEGAAIVAFGDSITDGFRSTADRNRRWTDVLERRLAAAQDGAARALGVVNRGISGNRLLSNPPPGSLAGRAALERFDRDVLATAGVRYVTVMLGINDIGHSSDDSPLPGGATDLIAGYRQLIARAHAHGLLVYCATLSPFEGAKYYSSEKEKMRMAVNDWIRGSEFDGVIDFDRALRDPARPTRILPAYDSGDHLHPNDAGYEAMGKAVPLALFSGPPHSVGK
ncbi:SGNH/GDSL hydrolase family protein [Massilia phyllosphaerae]|uniref:SGNH/GDSL hydrolase family protein n=1 Tax=Massilia phyllosphaerae TaxID=3106034 RepID=UPI002B1CE031|nr:SGNH/GDSL hydrolase family protein [Massilia sp. SGZ-792]